MTLTPSEGLANFAFSVASDKEYILTGDGITEGLLSQSGNIVTYYHYSEGSGSTLYDDSGNGNDADITSSVSWTTDGGYDGFGALDFPGQNGEGVKPPNYSKFSGYTIVTLAKLPQHDFGSPYHYGVNNATFLRTDSDNTEINLWHNDGSWQTLPIGINWDTWTMWTTRWDGSTLDFVKNDFAANPSVSASSISDRNDSQDWIGNAKNSYNLNGLISLSITWDVALTDSEISDLAQKLEI